MPIYEYACDKCGHEFEAEQRITDDPIRTCPSCRGRKVRRLISRTSFVLKGGGWYSDLYSSPGAKSDKGSEGTSSSDSPASGSKTGGDDKGKKGKSGKKEGKKGGAKAAA